ncbi:MAG: dTDP-glucose 4,6-dehydratase [bacterium]
MKLMITGGCGFIGSNFIRYVLEKYTEYQIINLDKLTYAGDVNNLKKVADNENYNFIQGDICNRFLVNKIVDSSIDCIINFAAESHVDRSIENPGIFIDTNVRGTETLLRAARKNKINKYIQISTDEVYGSLGQEGNFNEESSLAPNNPYAASKASADLLVRSYHKTYGLSCNIIRCTNNFGPYQYPEKLIPVLIINSLKNKKLPLYGDGKNVRDWIHVIDHCRAIDCVLNKGENGEIYNVGACNERTNLEVAEMILDILNKPKNLIEFVPDRPGHDRRYALDTGKIKNELGWKPIYDFAEGLSKTVAWYREHQTWWAEKISNY